MYVRFDPSHFRNYARQRPLLLLIRCPHSPPPPTCPMPSVFCCGLEFSSWIWEDIQSGGKLPAQFTFSNENSLVIFAWAGEESRLRGGKWQSFGSLKLLLILFWVGLDRTGALFLESLLLDVAQSKIRHNPMDVVWTHLNSSIQKVLFVSVGTCIHLANIQTWSQLCLNCECHLLHWQVQVY